MVLRLRIADQWVLRLAGCMRLRQSRSRPCVKGEEFEEFVGPNQTWNRRHDRYRNGCACADKGNSQAVGEHDALSGMTSGDHVRKRCADIGRGRVQQLHRNAARKHTSLGQARCVLIGSCETQAEISSVPSTTTYGRSFLVYTGLYMITCLCVGNSQPTFHRPLAEASQVERVVKNGRTTDV
ncbi:hypothetical protein BCR44DRAFT_303158 [Catenaria anguillulae PL171]|uniref:Uncharacterized protein n=1 Tax=Catenaria anguillulae PL171 TaxID=765915 RepID=A0A1Y2HR87_9FUNG|nr:hypothetical protein BCR44DRAFT_303158 [Catenaria anguillulae PL171]